MSFTARVKSTISTSTGAFERETMYVFKDDSEVLVNEWIDSKWKHYGRWHWDPERQKLVVRRPVTLDSESSFYEETLNDEWTEAYVRWLNRRMMGAERTKP